MFLSPELVDEVERFVAGQAPPEVPETVLATLLFTDIVGSTTRAAELGDQRWRELLGRHHALVRRELARFRGEERDTAGDGFFATFDGPARAIRCAQVIAQGIRELGLEIRAGVHTGECELHDGKVAGIAVSIGARVAAEAQPGEVLVTGTVKDLVAGSGLAFEPRGERELKGVPGNLADLRRCGGMRLRQALRIDVDRRRQRLPAASPEPPQRGAGLRARPPAVDSPS